MQDKDGGKAATELCGAALIHRIRPSENLRFRWRQRAQSHGKGPRKIAGLRMLTKSTDWQSLRKPARQGSKLADKGAYTGVSDRRLQVKLTTEAEIASEFYWARTISAFAGFVSALRRRCC